jgi:hypothetical protein
VKGGVQVAVYLYRPLVLPKLEPSTGTGRRRACRQCSTGWIPVAALPDESRVQREQVHAKQAPTSRARHVQVKPTSYVFDDRIRRER